MPNPRRARRSPVLLLGVAVASATALVASSLGTPAQAQSPQSVRSSVSAKAGETVLVSKREKRAQSALARAQRALGPSTGGKRPDATLALRKLWMLKDSLSPADRAVADRLAARPSKPTTAQTANLVIHYDPAELTTYTINDAISSLTYVADTYAGSGYRRPLPDGTLGGDSRTDIYLDQLTPGLYGYCTTDQTKFKGKGHDVWAYCVLDADYVGFTSNTPLQNLQVTAAHEYYHATQFAYDYYEDPWLLEATAAWAEDELYPDVNDNIQYLAYSPITKPSRSIDKFDRARGFHYGVWNFFRYLSEKYPTDAGALPGLLLDVWKAADSTKGPRKDKYSTQAINKALKKDGKTSLAEQFALYSAATTHTHTTFAEGAAQNYPVKPLGGSVALGPAAKKKQTFRTKLDHLTSDTFAFVPSGTAADGKLKVQLKMGPKQTGSRAVVVVYGPTGAIVSIKSVKVNRKGVAKKKFDFGTGLVSSVEVTLVNTSQRMRNCSLPQKSPYSCGGRPVDENVRAVVRAKAT